jgi:hypothetical protein
MERLVHNHRILSTYWTNQLQLHLQGGESFPAVSKSVLRRGLTASRGWQC